MTTVKCIWVVVIKVLIAVTGIARNQKRRVEEQRRKPDGEQRGGRMVLTDLKISDIEIEINNDGGIIKIRWGKMIVIRFTWAGVAKALVALATVTGIAIIARKNDI